jgi:Ca-activated chloride channel family protein
MVPMVLVAQTEFARRARILRSILGDRLLPILAPEADPRARPRKFRVWAVSAALMAVALARPQWGSHEEVVSVSGLDVMVVIDVSNSMYVEDVVPSRLKKARHVIRSFFERLSGDRAGLVAFAGSNFMASPLTTDTDYLIEVLESLDPESIGNQGTDIGSALSTAARALERGSEEGGENAPNEGGQSQASKAVILVSDGEDLEGGIRAGEDAVKAMGAKVFVLGVGTEKGGPIPLRDQTGTLRSFKKQPDGSPIVSAFHRDALESVAKDLGGRYMDITSQEGEVDEILNDLGGLQRAGRAERRYQVYEERFQIPLFLAIVILFLELSLPSIRAAGTAGLLLAAIVASGRAQAVETEVYLENELVSGRAQAVETEVYLENERGIHSLDQGRVDEAKRHFGSAQARDPDSPELMHNQGVVQLQEGDYAGASKAFDEAAKMALKANDPDLAGRSYYNQGLALQKNGKATEAVSAFSRAVALGKGAKDEKLEGDARKRLLNMAQQQQQKQQSQDGSQQQEQDQKDQQGQQQQDKEGQGKQDDQKDAQGKGQEKDKPKQYSQGKKNQNFKSEKLTKQDAERVMAELSDKEQQLQAKLRKQGQRQAGGGKDW